MLPPLRTFANMTSKNADFNLRIKFY